VIVETSAVCTVSDVGEDELRKARACRGDLIKPKRLSSELQ
jgi:hypothetical protein